LDQAQENLWRLRPLDHANWNRRKILTRHLGHKAYG
jgi:hypothetical protein